MPDRPPPLAYPDPPLTDGVVVLRQWARGDLGCVEEATQDPDIPKGTTVPATFTPAEGLAWIERQWSRHDEGTGLSQAIANAGRNDALGAAVLMARQPGPVEIGYWLIPRARGRGFGSRAVGLLARWAVTEAARASRGAGCTGQHRVAARLGESRLPARRTPALVSRIRAPACGRTDLLAPSERPVLSRSCPDLRHHGVRPEFRNDARRGGRNLPKNG
jgi:RimJ/RimL family protein N-acetyltransferase